MLHGVCDAVDNGVVVVADYVECVGRLVDRILLVGGRLSSEGRGFAGAAYRGVFAGVFRPDERVFASPLVVKTVGGDVARSDGGGAEVAVEDRAACGGFLLGRRVGTPDMPAPCDLPVDEGGYHGVALGGACREIDIAVDTVDSRAVTLDGLEFVVAGDADDETVGCRSQVDGAGQFIEADVRHHSRFVLPQPVAGGFGSRLRGEGKGRVFVNLAAQQRFRGVFADDLRHHAAVVGDEIDRVAFGVGSGRNDQVECLGRGRESYAAGERDLFDCRFRKVGLHVGIARDVEPEVACDGFAVISAKPDRGQRPTAREREFEDGKNILEREPYLFGARIGRFGDHHAQILELEGVALLFGQRHPDVGAADLPCVRADAAVGIDGDVGIRGERRDRAGAGEGRRGVVDRFCAFDHVEFGRDELDGGLQTLCDAVGEFLHPPIEGAGHVEGYGVVKIPFNEARIFPPPPPASSSRCVRDSGVEASIVPRRVIADCGAVGGSCAEGSLSF